MLRRFRQLAAPGLAALTLALSTQTACAQETQHPWEGWYGGGVLGISWTNVDLFMPPSSSSTDFNGILGGGILGINLVVTDGWLIGFETDLIFNDLGDDMTFARHRLSLLGRGGFFVTPSTLLFGVAGVAGGQYKAKVNTNVTSTTVIMDEVNILVTTVTNISGSREERLWGITFGAGIEQAGRFAGLPVRWGIEYRFTDFGDWDFSISGQPFNIDTQVQDLRFRAVFPF